ncbi:hemerythrin domain-containing protein [Massilia endophytica]|uniref:hemerythrin domain-containing protein n=1 Tax=Massilia endophytica TaxID=2899220 RepID=UPI001E5CE40D|nr:hemerythrin domain-containing protein [Massilia endophytica]UGQ44616.1 hemerythrin domain-containing protein [Massilia endophytica]
MLTATYTLVALSVEQASVRLSLQSFQKTIHANLMRHSTLSLAQLEHACEMLDQLYQACHWRKVELYLIPAVRQATERADKLLDELSRLNQNALALIRRVKLQVEQLGADGQAQAAAVCEAMDGFCQAMLKRLEKEETELFGIARTVIGGEAWFSIANQLLAHDAEVAEARRTAAQPGQPVQKAEPIALLPRAAPAAGAVQAMDIRVPDLHFQRRHRAAHRAAAE